MSLVKSDLFSVVKKQYLYKLETGTPQFVYLIIFQIFGMLASMGATGMSSTSNEVYTLILRKSSSIPIFVLSTIYIVSSINVVNSRESTNMDFTFTSNRLSSNLSSILFLLTFIFYSSFTVVLAGIFVRVIKYINLGSSNIVEKGFFLTPSELLTSFCAGFMYTLLCTSVLYLAAAFAQRSKLYLILLTPAYIFIINRNFYKISEIFFMEQSLLFFTLKVLLTAVVFFSASILVTNNLEVRR
jgi:hypothetical protein